MRDLDSALQPDVLTLLRSVLARHDVSNPRLVGSVARGTANAGSDIDLLVSPGRSVTLIGLQRLQHELQSIVGRRVDVVVDDGVPREVPTRMLREAIAP